MLIETVEIDNSFYAATRAIWHAWLETNHKQFKEIWLILYKKGTTTPSITYGEAVEEAICYGWIDSSVKGIDKGRYAQRFTPRRKGSNWTATNTSVAKKLIREGRMKAEGTAAFRTRKKGQTADKEIGKLKTRKER